MCVVVSHLHPSLLLLRSHLHLSHESQNNHSRFSLCHVNKLRPFDARLIIPFHFPHLYLINASSAFLLVQRGRRLRLSRLFVVLSAERVAPVIILFPSLVPPSPLLSITFLRRKTDFWGVTPGRHAGASRPGVLRCSGVLSCSGSATLNTCPTSRSSVDRISFHMLTLLVDSSVSGPGTERN